MNAPPARPLRHALRGIDARYVGCSPDTPVRLVTREASLAGPQDALVLLPGLVEGGRVEELHATAAGLLITHAGWPVPAHLPHVLVADPDRAYGQLAANVHGHPYAQLQLAGITGTNGKTTTATLVASMLSGAGRVHARMGTSTHDVVGRVVASGSYTTPLQFTFQPLLAEAVAAGATDVVMEITSHSLIELRTWPARFQVAAMTNVTRDHLDFHRTFEAYAAAKRSLSQHLAPGGLAVAMVDRQPHCRAFLDEVRAQGAQAWAASLDPNSPAELRVLSERWAGGVRQVELATPAGRGRFETTLIGDFNLENALVAVGVGLGLGLSLDQALEGVATASPPPGRQSWVRPPGPEQLGVMVDYAHTPDALERVLTATRPLTQGQLWVVVGCGGDRDRGKRPLMGAVATQVADRLVATMDEPRSEAPEAIIQDMLTGLSRDALRRVHVCVDRAAAIRHAIAEAQPGDVIVLAGMGPASSIELAGRTLPHSDAEVAAQALTSLAR